MLRKNPSKKEWKYIYILKVETLTGKSKYYGLRKIYYSGQTNNLRRRITEHLYKINSPFLQYNFPNSKKTLVFVKYIYGNEYDAIGEETEIKRMSREKKEELIKSEENVLVQYVPLRAIILKKNKSEGENVCIKL